MDDAAARASHTDAAGPSARLEALVPGMAVIYGGDKVAHVSPALAEAFRAGDRLVVGLNADESVRRLKGETRPVKAEPSSASWST